MGDDWWVRRIEASKPGLSEKHYIGSADLWKEILDRTATCMIAESVRIRTSLNWAREICDASHPDLSDWAYQVTSVISRRPE